MGKGSPGVGGGGVVGSGLEEGKEGSMGGDGAVWGDECQGLGEEGVGEELEEREGEGEAVKRGDLVGVVEELPEN